MSKRLQMGGNRPLHLARLAGRFSAFLQVSEPDMQGNLMSGLCPALRHEPWRPGFPPSLCPWPEDHLVA